MPRRPPWVHVLGTAAPGRGAAGSSVSRVLRNCLHGVAGAYYSALKEEETLPFVTPGSWRTLCWMTSASHQRTDCGTRPVGGAGSVTLTEVKSWRLIAGPAWRWAGAGGAWQRWAGPGCVVVWGWVGPGERVGGAWIEVGVVWLMAGRACLRVGGVGRRWAGPRWM